MQCLAIPHKQRSDHIGVIQENYNSHYKKRLLDDNNRSSKSLGEDGGPLGFVAVHLTLRATSGFLATKTDASNMDDSIGP